MPRVCTICTHPDRSAIDRALVAGEASNRRIASQYGVSERAIRSHRTNHLSAALVHARTVQDDADSIDVMAELNRCFARVNLLFDACDRWLRDADDPTRYDIGPRAEELDVTYEDVLVDDKGKPYTVRRKKKLSELLPTIERDNRTITLVETKHADPRDLVLKTANRLQGQMELLAKLLGELQQEGTTNIIVNPAWIDIRTVIVAALGPYPDAAHSVADALAALEGVKSHAAD